MATYRGSPFEAGIGPTDGDIVPFGGVSSPPEDLGFSLPTGHWRKQLPISEVQAVWESRPVGTFRGERCMVLDDLGDRLHIGYLGHNGYQAEQLGYWQVDRGVYELVAARSEVSDIIEERTRYPATARRHPGRARGLRPARELPAARLAAGSGAVPAAGTTRPGQLPPGPTRFLPDAGRARDIRRSAMGTATGLPVSGRYSWPAASLAGPIPACQRSIRPVRSSTRSWPMPSQGYPVSPGRMSTNIDHSCAGGPPSYPWKPAPSATEPGPTGRSTPPAPSSTGPGQPPSTPPAPSSTGPGQPPSTPPAPSSTKSPLTAAPAPVIRPHPRRGPRHADAATAPASPRPFQQRRYVSCPHADTGWPLGCRWKPPRSGLLLPPGRGRTSGGPEVNRSLDRKL